MQTRIFILRNRQVYFADTEDLREEDVVLHIIKECNFDDLLRRTQTLRGNQLIKRSLIMAAFDNDVYKAAEIIADNLDA